MNVPEGMFMTLNFGSLIEALLPCAVWIKMFSKKYKWNPTEVFLSDFDFIGYV